MPEPQPRALSEAERTELRAGLNSEEHLDEAPATKLLETATTAIIWLYR